MSLPQKQKDTIREKKKYPSARELDMEKYKRIVECNSFDSMFNYGYDFAMKKLDQIREEAYQQGYNSGAKDKVEEIVEHFIENWKEFSKLSPEDIRKMFKFKR